MKTLVLVVAWLFLSLGPPEGASRAAVDGDCIASSLEEATANCERSLEQTRELVTSTAALFRYRVELLCWDDSPGGICFNPRVCTAPPNTTLHALYRQPVAGGAWERDGTVCLGSESELEIEGRAVTVVDVLREFKSLNWPAATLSIQPPRGETLVNLDTIFYTESTAPVTRTPTLLGQSVTIRATPTAFTWHWTTGKDPTTDADKPLVTNHGGHPFPDQTITHRYSIAGIQVHPRLDVTYTGEYRVGNEPTWHPIPETRTITGTPQDLVILEARPTLVR